MSHLNSRDYGFVGPSASSQTLNSDTTYHRVNRAFTRRRSFTRIAWIVGLVVGVGIVVLWRA